MDFNEPSFNSDEDKHFMRIECEDRIIMTTWTKDLEDLGNLSRRFFDIPANATMDLITKVEGLTIPEAAWDHTDTFLSSILVLTSDRLPRGEGPMTIYVKRLNGATYTLSAQSCTTIYQLKRQIRDRTRTPEETHISLILNNTGLEDYNSLAHYHIEDHSTLYMREDMRGGADWSSIFSMFKKAHYQPPAPSQFLNNDLHLIRLHYQQRQVVTSWNPDFAIFKTNCMQILDIPSTQSVRLRIKLPPFGYSKVEVDPNTWPRIEGLFSDVWISDVEPMV